MRLLYSYLRRYWTLVVLALVLAAVNQIFSLLDPLIFRHVIDQYATRYHEYTKGQFFRGVSVLLAAAVGAAFVSRVAKNFQDYYINVITQRLGAELYSDGIRHSLQLPYSVHYLSQHVTAAVSDSTVILQVRAVDASPARAAQIANSVVSNLQQVVVTLSGAKGKGAVVTVTKITPASFEHTQSSLFLRVYLPAKISNNK